MKLPAHSILKKVVAEREVSLGDLLPLLPKKFNDYRDLFPIAFLCSSGFIRHGWSQEGESINDEYLLASILYSKSTGKKKVNAFNNPRGIADLSNTTFTATAKAELYFAELRSKRIERIITISIGIFIGVCSATLALLIKTSLIPV